MKLRLNANNIRLRLGPSQTRSLAMGSQIVETIAFGFLPSDRLIYSIQSAEIAEPTVTFADRHIAVRLPKEMVHHWARSSEVTLTSTHPTAGGVLTLVVEKDFACLHGEETDQDVFPNPNENEQILS